METNTDEISEKYRKYVVNVLLDKKEHFYLLWGTNLENEDVDYLLVNKSNSILAFLTIPDLVKYVNHANLLIDPVSTKKWANSYSANRPYCTYDLFSIKKTLEKGFSLEEIGKSEAVHIVDLCNLFSDYAYQTDSRLFLNQLEKKDIKIFCDYIYEDFFWDKRGSEEGIKGMTENFNFDNFRNDFMQLILLFEEVLVFQ